MRRLNTFNGPTAPWLDDEPEEFVLEYIKQRALNSMKEKLAQRIQALSDPHVSLDLIHLEIRRHVSDCAVTGNLIEASDLSDLMIELMTAQENLLRL